MVEKQIFGVTKEGKTVGVYRIINRHGLSVALLDYGCTLQSVVIPHRGKRVDVCLGYDTIREYEQNDGYLGAVIGRYAGRIPGGVLRLGDRSYPLFQNDGDNHLHGGRIGFDQKIFHAETTDSSVCFNYHSPDGEEGYPASLSIFVTYELSEDDVLKISFRGCADGVTVWNPTSHAYWNLNGHQSGSALSHRLRIPADRYVPVGKDLIPSDGERDVSGTPFDFLDSKPISEGFKSPCIRDANGYDHSFVLSGHTIELDGINGIRMQIITDSKAVQLYTANYLSERIGKGNAVYRPHDAVCLETEARQIRRNGLIPDESMLAANTPKEHTTAFRFLYE